MIASVFLMLHIFFGNPSFSDMKEIGAKIWYERIAPDYDLEMYRVYELNYLPEKLPFKGVKSYTEQLYTGAEVKKGIYDTVPYSNNRMVFILNDAGFVVEYWYQQFSQPSGHNFIAYDHYPNGLLKSVTRSYQKASASDYIWNIEYDENQLVKRHVLRKMNGRLIAERTFDYYPAERKIVSKTTYGKDHVLEDATYRYDRSARLSTIERHAYLTKQSGLTTFQYTSGALVRESTIWKDSMGVKVSEINSLYKNNQLIDRYQYLARNKVNNPKTEQFEYYKNGMLKSEVSNHWGNRSKSSYTYLIKSKQQEMWEIEVRKPDNGAIKTYIVVKTYKTKNPSK
jgi:hypothetical protein